MLQIHTNPSQSANCVEVAKLPAQVAKPALRSRIDEIRQRHLIAQTLDSKRKEADPLLQQILSAHSLAETDLGDAVEKWESCRTEYTRMVPVNGKFETKTYPYNCKLPFCQRCNSWMKRKQADLMLERFRMIVGDSNMRLKDFSVVTVNGPLLSLGADFGPARKKMASKLRYRFSKLTGSVLQGEFEIAKVIKGAAKNALGKLHVHGVLYHPRQSRDEVKAELKRAFPEPRAVQVAATFTERNNISPSNPKYDELLDNDIATYSEYSSDVDIRIDDHGGDTSTILLNHLLSICSIWSGGKRGLRFNPGLRSAFKQRGLTISTRNQPSLRQIIIDNPAPISVDKDLHLSDVFREELVLH